MEQQLTSDSLITKHRIGISGSTLKFIAVFSMLIDHISASLLQNEAINQGNPAILAVAQAMRVVGRLAFPIFCFLLIEGFLHTSNVKKYALRLALFALISEIPFDLAFEGTLFDFSYQNVFFTLLIGLMVLIGFRAVADRDHINKWLIVPAVFGILAAGYILLDYYVLGVLNVINYVCYYAGIRLWIGLNTQSFLVLFALCVALGTVLYLTVSNKQSRQKANVLFTQFGVLAVGMSIASLLLTDYYEFGVLTIAVMYALRNRRALGMTAGVTTLTFALFNEFPAALDIPLVALYNGKRGLRLKYFFYIFYPAHLMLLYLIGQLLIKG